MVDAENWDEFFNEVYPEFRENLWTGPKRVRVSLPLEARDETKEQGFRQMLLKDSKEIIETLSGRGGLRTYGESFKNNIMPLRILAYMPSGLAIIAPAINPLLIIGSIAYVAAVEGLSYRATKKDKERVIRNLENLGDKISVHYMKNL